jgi:hypothetical protein
MFLKENLKINRVCKKRIYVDMDGQLPAPSSAGLRKEPPNVFQRSRTELCFSAQKL